LELAEAIVRDAGALAARVIVNRVWLHHFGRGLVETPSNFGNQGSRPTHPELLDDLAARFVEHNWSIKWLHREVMLSAAYRQSSSGVQGQVSNDPDNRFLARMNRKRSDFEGWRDSILAVCGDLDRRIGGPPVGLNEPTNRRRTIYGTVHRRELSPMLRLHDFPDPTAHSPARQTTTTPLQQLFVLNSDFIRRRAESLAQRLVSEVPSSAAELRVEWLYQELFSRQPTDFEIRAAIDFIENTSSEATKVEAWTQYSHVLLGSNEFVFVD
jgi:hypothetical protein